MTIINDNIWTKTNINACAILNTENYWTDNEENAIENNIWTRDILEIKKVA